MPMQRAESDCMTMHVPFLSVCFEPDQFLAQGRMLFECQGGRSQVSSCARLSDSEVFGAKQWQRTCAVCQQNISSDFATCLFNDAQLP